MASILQGHCRAYAACHTKLGMLTHSFKYDVANAQANALLASCVLLVWVTRTHQWQRAGDTYEFKLLQSADDRRGKAPS